MTNNNEIKKEIVLPQYEWFVNKKYNKPVSNIFTGSLGTDKQYGCTASTIFNYKVYVVDAGKDATLIVGECYISKPCNNQNKKELLSTSKADCSYSG